MLALLLWLLALLALGVAAVALAPVRLGLRAETAPRPRFRIGASLLGGSLPAIPLYDSARKPARKPKPDKPHRLRRGQGRGGVGALPTGAGRALGRLLADLARIVRFDHLRLDAEYGLGDPAETGQLCGWLAPLACGLGGRRGVSVALRPDFGDCAVLKGELDAGFRITPAALLPPAFRFAWALWGPGR